MSEQRYLVGDKLARLYELAGAEVDRERGLVKMTAAWIPQPVELVVRAVPVEMTYENGYSALRFRVLTDPKLVVDGGQVTSYELDNELTFTPEQLRFNADEINVVTDAMIAAFKAAWHEADEQGKSGDRVRAGLEAALRTVD